MFFFSSRRRHTRFDCDWSSDVCSSDLKRGLPVLVGTVSVDVSETLSRMLKRRGLRHEVLNAKYHEREAEIVAQAGQPAAITIPTNMAGRGPVLKIEPPAHQGHGVRIHTHQP